jgi:hypothetical protein
VLRSDRSRLSGCSSTLARPLIFSVRCVASAYGRRRRPRGQVSMPPRRGRLLEPGAKGLRIRIDRLARLGDHEAPWPAQAGCRPV